MIRRTVDAAFLNALANEPATRAGLFGEGEIDLTQTLLDTANYALVCDDGGFVLTAHGAGSYEVHSIFRPGEGKAIPAMLAAMDWMFTRTDCQRIVSKVPVSNRAAKGLALKGGLKTLFTRDDATFGATEYVELTLERWAMRTPKLERHGERFHALLEQAKRATGSELPVHPHDPAHERAVGAAVLMIERGQGAKGVDFYNHWARLAGYAPVRLLSLSPPTVDAVDAVVGLGENGMEVLLCR